MSNIKTVDHGDNHGVTHITNTKIKNSVSEYFNNFCNSLITLSIMIYLTRE